MALHKNGHLVRGVLADNLEKAITDHGIDIVSLIRSSKHTRLRKTITRSLTTWCRS
jgi:hypothetical protein